MTGPSSAAGAPEPAGSLGELEREITRFLRRARASSHAMAAEVHPDLDASGYAVLVTVVDLGATMPDGVRAADVGATLQLHKSTMSRNVADLVRLGLLEQVPDHTDARARLLALTPSGRQSLDRSRAGRRARVAGRLARWAESDVRELARLLARLNDDMS